MAKINRYYSKRRKQRQHEAIVNKLIERASRLPDISNEEERLCEASYRRATAAMAQVLEAERLDNSFHKVIVRVPVEDNKLNDNPPRLDIELTLDGELKDRPFRLVVDFDTEQPSAKAVFAANSQGADAAKHGSASKQEANDIVQEDQGDMEKSFSSVTDLVSEEDEGPTRENVSKQPSKKSAARSDSRTSIEPPTGVERATPGCGRRHSEEKMIATIRWDEDAIATNVVQSTMEVTASLPDKPETPQEMRKATPDGQSDKEDTHESQEEVPSDPEEAAVARQTRGAPKQRKAAKKSISRIQSVLQLEKQEDRRRDAERKRQQRRKASSADRGDQDQASPSYGSACPTGRLQPSALSASVAAALKDIHALEYASR